MERRRSNTVHDLRNSVAIALSGMFVQSMEFEDRFPKGCSLGRLRVSGNIGSAGICGRLGLRGF
jgi:hypothetical protein